MTSRINALNANNIDPEKILKNGLNRASTNADIQFDDLLNQALVQSNVMDSIQQTKAPLHNFNATAKIEFDDDDDIEKEEGLLGLFAQIDQENVPNILSEIEQRDEQSAIAERLALEDLELKTKRYEITPFQIFMDKSFEVLENVSKLDRRVNDLTEQFMRGEVSVDEVGFEMSKLNLAISFATTVLSSATQTFKEITQLAI
ncbi:hypothetical protein DID76_04435 [Candidatus Marinamargulisbacteria bacterium SCGC AG-414-C22]|nr:hypothetical protein DID76_04435 [Candidatus Marinamargulisbacteria bacterium SCGC AG-414-C22]